MAAALLVICASALFVQSAYSACFGAGYAGAPLGLAGGIGYGAGLAYDGFGYGTGLAYDGFGYGAGLAYDGFGYGAGCGGVASTGGGLPCASVSSFPPVGVSVLSENVYEGALAVGGNLPFLGTVAMEGILPTVGAGAVSYGCGAGGCGIAVEEGPIATGIAPSVGGYGFGPGVAGIGYNGGFGGYGAYGFGGLAGGCGGAFY